MKTESIRNLLPDSPWKQRLRRNVLRWFDRHARDLPWRDSKSPYRVWISEVMLQQTQVATVIDYYQRFVRRFPTVRALARADQHDVLLCWEGLGYYRRAQQLHRAARQVVELHGGEFPTDFDHVRALPGIGRYTAGAILSIACNQRHPVVEANTTRLFCRLLAYEDDPRGACAQQLLWTFAADILPRRRPGDFNQAAMEVGSIVCTPRRPQCDRCPAATLCATRARGLQHRIPLPKKRPSVIATHEAVVVVRRGNHVLLHCIPPGRRWAGLWDYPRFETGGTSSEPQTGWLETQVKQATGLTVNVGRHFKTIRHSVTRYRITLSCYEADCQAATQTRDEWRWVAVGDLANYPLSATGRKISRIVARAGASS